MIIQPKELLLRSSIKWMLSLVAVATINLTIVQAQSSPYYIIAGDQSNRMTTVQNGLLTSTVNLNAPGQILYPIAVQNTLWIADRGINGGSKEFTLAGVPTGNSATYGPGNDQLLDGTTDGRFNYAVQFGNAIPGVYRANLDWSNQTLLFSVPNLEDGLGITFDTSTGHLFVSSIFGKTYEMTMAGTVLNTLPIGIKSLAYEQTTDTLWGTSGIDTVVQFNKTTGAILQSLTIAGANFGNNFGGEMAIAVPEPTTWALIGVGAVGAGVYAWRKKRLANKLVMAEIEV